jgi:hypothetical protein
MSRDNAVNTATGYPLDVRGVIVRVPVCSQIVSMLSRRVLVPTQPPIQTGCRGTISLAIMRLGREADHSPVTSAEVKKTWIFISTPPYVFTA